MVIGTLHFVSEATQAGESVVITSWVELLTLSVVSSGITAFWIKHNCHEHRCWRLSWHPDAEGHPICKVHHDEHPSRGLWWAIKHFLKTRELGDHDHPRHAKSKQTA
jgi:hypothetical protein